MYSNEGSMSTWGIFLFLLILFGLFSGNRCGGGLFGGWNNGGCGYGVLASYVPHLQSRALAGMAGGRRRLTWLGKVSNT